MSKCLHSANFSKTTKQNIIFLQKISKYPNISLDKTFLLLLFY